MSTQIDLIGMEEALRFAEYYPVGTLTSVLTAVVTGITVKLLW